jgi:eukaryotic-like serine/threonine-protein kinase
MKFTEQEWFSLSRLLDEALALPESERQAWLEALPVTPNGLGPTLRELLGRHAAAETDDFLKTLPRLGVPVAADTVSGLREGVVVGPYRLLRELGRGGMGTVWMAERIDGTLKRTVALKLPHSGLPVAQLAERFARERDILAALVHPHIARLYDAGVAADGQPFLALEYVEGQPIGIYCDARHLDVPSRLLLFLQVLSAVQYAHAHLVVHRDLKPSNVLVTDDGQVRLLDFGIAKLIAEGAANESELTQAAGVLLTPDYASPEQISGAALTIATDIYSLGVILYELVTGERPYRLKRGSRAALEEAILEAEAARPSAACKDLAKAELRGLAPAKLEKILRGDLDTIVLKALKKSPVERYPSVTAFADDIRRYLSHETVSARPDSLGYRAAKFVRRNRLAVGLSGVAVVAMVAGLGGTITQTQRATRQAAIGQEQRDRADLQARVANEQRDFALRQLSRAEAVNDLNAFLLSDAAPSGKPFTAGELLARAEAVIERQHDESDANRAEMLVAVGRLHQRMDHDAEARRLLERAYDMSRKLADRSTLARAACALASAISPLGERERAESLLHEALAALPAEPQFVSDRIGCFLSGSHVAQNTDDPAEAVARARAAQELLPQLSYPSTRLEMSVLMNLAESYRQADQYQAAAGTFERAHSLLSALGRENTEGAGSLFNNWALVLQQMGQTLKAEELFRRAALIGSADGTDKNVSPMLLNNLARTLWELDRNVEAARYADQAYERARVAGDEMVVRQSLMLRARVYRTLGDHARAGQLLTDLEARLRRAQPVRQIAYGAVAFERALLAQARGDSEAATAGADKAVAIAEAEGPRSHALANYLRLRAELELAQNRIDAAQNDAARAIQLDLEVAAPGTQSRDLGLAYLALGRALLAKGQPEGARNAFSSALEQLRPTLGADHPQTRLAERLLAKPDPSARR